MVRVADLVAAEAVPLLHQVEVAHQIRATMAVVQVLVQWLVVAGEQVELVVQVEIHHQMEQVEQVKLTQ